MTSNPWLPSREEPQTEVRSPAPPPVWAPGADVEVSQPLASFPVSAGGLWVMGAHGGAGATTLARLTGLLDAGVLWPVPETGSPHTRVVVVARTSHVGIEAAHRAALQWASGALPGVVLTGVVWVADAPGRLPRPLRREVSLVSGAFPANEWVPWFRPWRAKPPDTAPKAVSTALRKILGEELTT